MTLLSLPLLRGVLAALVLLSLLLTLVIVLTRVRRSRARTRHRALLAPLREDLYAVGAGEDPDGGARQRLAAVRGPARGHLLDAAVPLLGKVRGAPVAHLVALLEAHGAVAAAERGLTARGVVTRARALWLLGLLGDPRYVPRLVEGLRDRSVEVRTVAVRSLGAVGDPAAAGAVLGAVRARGDAPGVPAALAADTLLDMGSGAEPALLDHLADPDAGVRRVAATVLGEGRCVAAAAPLRRLLDGDPDPDVRVDAVRALGLVGGAADVPTVVAATGASRAPRLRRAAAAALGEIGDPAAVPALDGLLADPDRRLADVAGQSMAMLGAPGLAALAAAGDPREVRGESPTARARAAHATLARVRLRQRDLAR